MFCFYVFWGDLKRLVTGLASGLLNRLVFGGVFCYLLEVLSGIVMGLVIWPKSCVPLAALPT